MITSSPGPKSSDASARCRPVVPLLTAMANSVPQYRAKFASNSSMYFPIEDTQPESSASSTSSFSRGPINGCEIGMNGFDMLRLLYRSHQRLKALPLDVLGIMRRYHVV